MDRGVVDASVVTKWFLEEEFSEAARRLRDDYAADVFQVEAPTLLPYEVLNAARYEGSFREEELHRLAGSMERIAIPLHPLEGPLANACLTVAVASDLTVYDASYVALAQHLRVPLYTADEHLLAAAKEHVDASHIRDYRGVED